MKKQYFQDTETGELFTLCELKTVFETWLEVDASEEEKAIYTGHFYYWLKNCRTENNGVLREIYL